jgi:hypothetical protein
MSLATAPCLQDHRKRPDTSTLLSYRAVQTAAAELGLSLPAVAQSAAKPALMGIAPHVMAGVGSSAGPGALTGAGLWLAGGDALLGSIYLQQCVVAQALLGQQLGVLAVRRAVIRQGWHPSLPLASFQADQKVLLQPGNQ